MTSKLTDSRQCPNGDGIYTLLYALYKYSTSITNQPTKVNRHSEYNELCHKLLSFTNMLRKSGKSINWLLKCTSFHWSSTVNITPSCRLYASVNWVSIGSGNGLSPIRCQAITWANAGVLSVGPVRTHFSEIRIGILVCLFKKMQLELSSAKMAAILSSGWWVNTDWGVVAHTRINEHR